MTLIRTLELPGPPEQAWDLLVQRQGALRCAPGLTVGGDGRGTLRIVLDGHSLTYRGYARQHIEEPGRHATWTLSGKEVRGTGRAHAEIRARFKEQGNGTGLRLTVLVEGRGRLAEVPEVEQERAIALALGRFGREAAKELGGGEPVQSPPAAPRAKAAAEPRGEERHFPTLEIVPPEDLAPGRGFPLAPALAGAAALVAAVLLWRFSRRS
ncbi:MAG: hypothetical protein ACREN4_05520 [Candidatus Dormibacteria bacterium]